MTEFLTFDLQRAYAEIKEGAEAEGVTDKEGWDSLVEIYLNEKLDVGELHLDQDTEGFEDNLKAKFIDYQANLKIR